MTPVIASSAAAAASAEAPTASPAITAHPGRAPEDAASGPMTGAAPVPAALHRASLTWSFRA
ncbi:hypothetical protein [Homoserinibacter sp. YIM 151385]|uniref:hypothetical protein n=1 Tax=Homoserinibacter sp. YIM 151385 TaxID=2985506 RepID=UPI0022F0A744|nr:hypothetical protein [Homoserinibacter sp. YIM 151385]WBU36790.1 hypothetical protein OF852_07515 [Homoserinibacter sp. YIM 151385]